MGEGEGRERSNNNASKVSLLLCLHVKTTTTPNLLLLQRNPDKSLIRTKTHRHQDFTALQAPFFQPLQWWTRPTPTGIPSGRSSTPPSRRWTSRTGCTTGWTRDSRTGKKGIDDNDDGKCLVTRDVLRRCLKIGGQDALDRWVRAQEELVYCVLQNFDKDTIKQEVEDKKETGDLDLVFKKYCE